MKNKYIVYLFVLLLVVYFGQAMLLPTDPSVLARFNISQNQARLLNLTVVIPIMLIWITALYGFLKFKMYVQMVGDSEEGQPLNTLSNGLMILAFSLPLSSILSSVMSYMAFKNPDILSATTIIRNYSSLIFSVATFLTLSKGARNLLATAQSKSSRQLVAQPKDINLLLIILAVTFTWLIVSQPLNGVVDQGVYYLPDWLVITTLAIPYLIAWSEGMLAAYCINAYRDRVKGEVYKEAFINLSQGISVVVFTSIIIQLLITLSAVINRLKLTPVLLVIYLLVILYGVGFGLVARGTRKLKKIEDA